MNKVLPGTAREALGFIAVHWMSLLKMSVIPYALYLAVNIYQLKSLGSLYRRMGEAMTNPAANPDFMGSYMSGMALSSLVSFLAIAVLGLLFAQIIRFHKTGVADWFMMDKAGLGAGLMTLVYGIGITLLTLLVYIGGVIAFAIVMALLGVVFGGGSAGMALIGVFGTVGILGLVAGLYWFMFRFMVGLPGVALGSSPDFFKDMWPLSKGESWGVPGRMFLATIVAYIPMIFIFLIFGGTMFSDFVDAMSQQSTNPTAVFPVMANMMENMLPISIAMTVVLMPFMWFMALLLGIAFQRFRARV